MADSPPAVLLLSSMYTRHPFTDDYPGVWGVSVARCCAEVQRGPWPRWGRGFPICPDSYIVHIRTHYGLMTTPLGGLFLPLGRVGQRRRWTTNCGQQEATSVISYTIFFLHSYCYTYPWRTRGDIGAILHRYFTLYFMWFRNQVYWTNVTIF
jgi:hypothetical protein